MSKGTVVVHPCNDVPVSLSCTRLYTNSARSFRTSCASEWHRTEVKISNAITQSRHVPFNMSFSSAFSLRIGAVG